ncbi:zinc finger CCCH domain-containing protein 14-like [Wolffia australiana]
MDLRGIIGKRVRGPEAAVNGSSPVGGLKRPRESESFQPGLGSKSKPCTKFFSTSGCPFGEGCHFLHYVPGGISAVAQMTHLPNHSPLGHPMAPAMPPQPPPPAVKTRLCNNFSSPEGCRFGDKCHFAHGERELGMPILPTRGGAAGGRFEPPPPAAASFGAEATAKISVDASLSGAIIGKGGVNTKQICRLTGAKLSIREHESDPGLRNIEMEGSFEQIKQASAMVRELIVNLSGGGRPALAMGGKLGGGAAYPQGGNFKTKICENFVKGTCTFGPRCHFAHGPAELRKPAV